MAGDTITFLNELELKSAQIAELSERSEKIDEVSPRQARRKVAHVSKRALWFAHSFEFTPLYSSDPVACVHRVTHDISEWNTHKVTFALNFFYTHRH